MNARSVLLLRFGSVAALSLAFFIGRWTAVNASKIAVSERAVSGVGGDAKMVEKGGSVSNLKLESSVWLKRFNRPLGSLAAEDERQQLLEQWAASDPMAAIDFARKQLKGDRLAQALSSILSIWGKNNPAAAWNWVEVEMPDATHHFDNLLEVFGRNSPELAARYAAMRSLTHPEAATELNLAALLGVSYTGNFAAACAIIDRNAGTNLEMRKTLSNFVAGQWARYAPAEAKAWVMSLPEGALRNHALIGFGESWSEVDPAGAAAFAAELPEGEARTLAMRQSISKWVETNPHEARAWVMQTNQTQDFDAALEAIATQNNFMYREPASAMVWATGIFNDAQRAKTMGVVLHNWYAIDSKAALNYLNTSREFTAEQREVLLKQLPPSG